MGKKPEPLTEEQIATLPFDELEARREYLVGVVMHIQAQLSDHRQMNGASDDEFEDYQSWRKTALDAKRHSVAELRLVKDAIKKLNVAKYENYRSNLGNQIEELRARVEHLEEVAGIPFDPDAETNDETL